MKIRWAKSAQADLSRIRDYIYIRNPRAADEVKHRIISASRRFLDHPEIGRATQRHRFRLLPVTGLPYLLIYRVSSDYIDMASVIGGRMDGAPDLS